MSEYIDRDKTLKAVFYEMFGLDSYLRMAREAIKNVPSSDVVEVVRCKDCKYKSDFGAGAYKCSKSLIFHKEDWYCPNGIKE